MATMLLESKFSPNWLKRLKKQVIQVEWQMMRERRKEKWMRIMPRVNNDAFIINK